MSREYETPDPRDASSYPYWEEHKLRFADMDILNHINHVAIKSLFESARVQFWGAPKLYPFGEDEGIMQVRVEVEYLWQLREPGRLQIGSRVMKVGEKSIIWRQGMFNEQGRCCAIMATTSAYADYKAARSKPIPPALKAFLAAEMDKRRA